MERAKKEKITFFFSFALEMIFAALIYGAYKKQTL